jgi:hypothetical protein
LQQTENGEAGTLVFSAGRLDSGLSTNWQGEGGRREEKGIEEEKGRERRGGGEGERYKEEEFRFSLQADGGKEKRRRELRQETRRYWAQLLAVRYRHNEVSGWRLKLYEGRSMVLCMGGMGDTGVSVCIGSIGKIGSTY